MPSPSLPPAPHLPALPVQDAHGFEAFGTSHLAVLGICGGVLVFLITVKLLRWQKLSRGLELMLAGVLLALFPLTTLVHWRMGSLDLNKALPLQFCDVAAIAGGIALWKHRQWACEIVYFMGLAGTLQGLITPNLVADFPDLRFIAFFLLHGGVVVTALYVVTAMRHSPPPGAVGRLMKITLSYAAVVGLINWALGTNYAFLCQKPFKASLMDSLGTWPWYIGGLILLALVFYTVLNLPFVILRRVRAQSS